MSKVNLIQNMKNIINPHSVIVSIVTDINEALQQRKIRKEVFLFEI